MLDYRDAYLSRHCTDALETLAYAEVDLLGTFTTAWRDKLTIIKCYIMACLENQADPEDLYSEKYKIYSKEFEGLLAQARTAAEDDEGNYAPIYSIPLERS